MIRLPRGGALFIPGWFVKLSFLFVLLLSIAVAQDGHSASRHAFYIDCASAVAGDGSSAHPWNSLAAAQAHTFAGGDRIALARGSVCQGSFSPQGTGAEGHPIRLTAYGQGPRPRIVAAASDRQILSLFNQEYWQIDSLDLSGANTYGIYVSGDKGKLHHIYLENLYVHDVMGEPLKTKDSGLVLVGPGSAQVSFDGVLVDGVTAAHTNQWAGILIGGGNYANGKDALLNSHVTIRNSSVQDVFGDGIVLFRDSDSVIETSTAWLTGMQPTETHGTPNAIWTWTCTDCTVRDNEAFLTDSPGVDGGAYDIDWDNHRNIVERNYAHDTQGYCIAVFAAGYVTDESVVRDNLCIDNGLSPRLAANGGAINIYTWNGGVLRGVRIEHNTVRWNPPVPTAAAMVVDAKMEGAPAVFAGNRIESVAPLFYRNNGQLSPSGNTYRYDGDGVAKFTFGERHNVPLSDLQDAGIEKGSTLEKGLVAAPAEVSLRLDATVDFTLDADGLLASGPRAQLMVLRSLAAQYGPAALAVTVHLQSASNSSAEEATAQANALLDLDAAPIRFDREQHPAGVLRLLCVDGRLLNEWHGFQNAATLGGAVRAAWRSALRPNVPCNKDRREAMMRQLIGLRVPGSGRVQWLSLRRGVLMRPITHNPLHR